MWQFRRYGDLDFAEWTTHSRDNFLQIRPRRGIEGQKLKRKICDVHEEMRSKIHFTIQENVFVRVSWNERRSLFSSFVH